MVPLPRLFYLSLFSFPMPVGRVSRQQAVAFERLGHHLSGRVDRRNKYTFFFFKKHVTSTLISYPSKTCYLHTGQKDLF